MSRLCVSLVLVLPLLLLQPPPPAEAQQSEQALADEGHRLAALLRVGRSVVSANQGLINDPDIGDKGLDSDSFLAAVDTEFRRQFGNGPLEGDLTAEQRRLTEAQLAAMAEVLDENQDLINTQGLGFKGFIPAVFGRLVNERFADKVGEVARIKVTAPDELVRNRKARPDTWEAQILTDKLAHANWPRSQAYYEMLADADSDGPVFRMLIPEYYSESCLTCHGGPKGEVDVTGFPKEGGEAGDLAGAISILLKP